MSDAKSLYGEDFFLWSKEQAEALRAAARGATNQPIDWDNVAEEIESLGRSDKRELSSQIRPSLRNQVENTIAAESKRASRKVVIDLEEHGELDPAMLGRIRATAYTVEQILSDWFAPAPAQPG